MRIKDTVLGGLITLNLTLLVLIGAVALFGHEPAARAGGNDVAGFFHACTLRYADTHEGLAIIDTTTNKLSFYVNQAGRQEFTKVGTIDLAKAFGHPGAIR